MNMSQIFGNNKKSVVRVVKRDLNKQEVCELLTKSVKGPYEYTVFPDL